MSEDRQGAWVGDHVWDEDASREGIVADVQGGVFILRELYTWTRTWEAPGNERLTVLMPREHRARHREHS